MDGEELVFNCGDQRVCHTLVILNDKILEYPPNENYFSNVKFLSGVQPIIVGPQATEVVIDYTTIGIASQMGSTSKGPFSTGL